MGAGGRAPFGAGVYYPMLSVAAPGPQPSGRGGSSFQILGVNPRV